MTASKQAGFNPAEHLTNLKGKDYLEVKWRLVWLRAEHPDATIETDVVELTDQRCVFRARVTLSNGAFSTGYGSETPGDFKDFIEKAETKAIGRALAALGYGTQFAPEMDEGERIADSPVQRKTTPQKGSKATANDNDKQITEAAIVRLHGLLEERGLSKEHLIAYAIDQGCDNPNELTMGQAIKIGNGLKDKPEVAVKYLDQLKTNQDVAAMADAKKEGKK